MKRIIDISEEDYNFLIEHENEYNYERTRIAPILNSTPLKECEAEDCISRKEVLNWYCLTNCGRNVENCRNEDGECDDYKALKLMPPVYPKSDKPTLDDFIDYAKREFGVNITVKKSDNPDTVEKLFGECEAEDCRSLKDIKEMIERKADALDGQMLDAGGVCIGLYFAIANDLPSVYPKNDNSDSYAKGYNEAMRKISLSGDLEKQYNRGKADGLSVLENIKAEIAEHLKIMDICNVQKDNGIIVQSEITGQKVVSYDSVMNIIDKHKLKDCPLKEVSTGKCKDCKWWRDSDGEYRRGCRAESICPINTKTVFLGEGYCYRFEQKMVEEQGEEE